MYVHYDEQRTPMAMGLHLFFVGFLTPAIGEDACSAQKQQGQGRGGFRYGGGPRPVSAPDGLSACGARDVSGSGLWPAPLGLDIWKEKKPGEPGGCQLLKHPTARVTGRLAAPDRDLTTLTNTYKLLIPL